MNSLHSTVIFSFNLTLNFNLTFNVFLPTKPQYAKSLNQKFCSENQHVQIYFETFFRRHQIILSTTTCNNYCKCYSEQKNIIYFAPMHVQSARKEHMNCGIFGTSRAKHVYGER